MKNKDGWIYVAGTAKDVKGWLKTQLNKLIK